MKYELRASKIENPTNDVVGMASVTIEDKFVVNNIRIIDKGENGMSIMFPARKSTKTESGYTNIAHPYTSELYQNLKEAILNAYVTGENQLVETEAQFELKTKVTPFEKDSLKGFCSVQFCKENEFAINDITIRSGDDKVFVAMPTYKKKDGEFANICNPITKEFREELDNALLDGYKNAIENKKEKSNSKSATFTHKPSSR